MVDGETLVMMMAMISPPIPVPGSEERRVGKECRL